MSKIKVTVKGELGSGYLSVAASIRQALERAGAKVKVKSLDAVFVRADASYNGLSHSVELRTKQLPRAERPDLPAMEFTERFISDEEWIMVQTMRGQKMTGYSIHKTKDGRFYYWSWGSQPSEADVVAGATPMEAAANFLEVFEPRDMNDPNAKWSNHIWPKLKQVAA
jgi:hypothetical protein